MDRNAIVDTVRSSLPGVLAVYAFGSRIRGDAGPQSDLDLAVLVAGYADPLALWHAASRVAVMAGFDVDLLDLRAASTVMQHQVLTQGERWWVGEDQTQVGLFEAAMLTEKLWLDDARAATVRDVLARGRVYG
jgi:uncharacterized protein